MTTRPDLDPASQSALLRQMFDAAVARGSAALCVPPFLPPQPAGRTVVIGAGKAAAAMAQVVERHWNGPLFGAVVTRHGHAVPCERIDVYEAGHPVPDASSVFAAQGLLRHLDGVTCDDLVLCLISGGGSALLAAPPPNVPLVDLQAVTRAMLRSGADIGSMNCVRRHLSLVAGGRLALAAVPARLVTLAISDVPGDDPATIASGPTVADRTTRKDALAILRGLDIAVPPSVHEWLDNPMSETPKPGDLPAADYQIVATPGASLDAAAAVAERAGFRPIVLGSDLEGEARAVARDHARKVRELLQSTTCSDRRIALLSGGETSVTVRGSGRGGRNGEFLLALALELDGIEGIYALAADTDGIDGSEDNAGAIIRPDTLMLARHQGLRPETSLEDNDAYGFFAAIDALVMTGPTHTNVNDFRAILIDRPSNGVSA